MKRILNYLHTLAVLMAFTGCQGDDIIINTKNEDDNRHITIAAPMAKISYTLADLVNDIDEEYLLTHENGALFLTYLKEVFVDWESLVTLRDIIETWRYPLSTPDQTKSSGSLFVSENIPLNHREDVRYDKLTLKSGTMSIEIEVPPGSSGSVIIALPQAEAEGHTLSLEIPVLPWQSTYRVTYDLTNATVTPGQTSDTKPFESYLTVETAANLSGFSGDGELGLTLSLTDMKHEEAFGYFGQQESSSLDARLDFDAFDKLNITEGIVFGDAELEIRVNNHIGAPFYVKADNIRFYKEKENTEPDWLLELNAGTEADMQVASATYGRPVIPSKNLVLLNASNSNILEIGNNYPLMMLCDIFSTVNPEDTGEQNFMGVMDNLLTNLIVNIPLYFRATDYTRTDTIAFDFNDLVDGNQNDARKVTNFELFIDFFSKVPFDIKAKAWVEDETGNNLAEIIRADLLMIKAGQPGPNERIANAEKTSVSVKLTNNQIQRFIDDGAKRIILESKYVTYGNGLELVQLYDDMSIETVVSFIVDGQVPKLD